MFLFTTKEEYLSPFIMELSQSERKSDKIQEYMNLLVTQLDKLVDELSKDNFWTCLLYTSVDDCFNRSDHFLNNCYLMDEDQTKEKRLKKC
ncbi:hypothetical protein A5876_003421, partial [Enterococcus sp. 3C8_DIV0646]